MKRFSAIFLAASMWVPVARGAIEFETKMVDVKAAAGVEKVTATFAFKNSGSIRERIVSIDSNCGCLSAKADRYVLEPGQSGTLTAVFNVKGKQGLIGKALTVSSAGAKRESTQLEVRVFLPQLVVLEPNTVVWKVGETPSPKTVRVRMEHDSPIRILKVETSRSNVTTELVAVEEGKTYEIRITPQSTATPVLGVVRLDTDCPVPEQRRQMAFFRVEK